MVLIETAACRDRVACHWILLNSGHFLGSTRWGYLRIEVTCLWAWVTPHTLLSPPRLRGLISCRISITHLWHTDELWLGSSAFTDGTAVFPEHYHEPGLFWKWIFPSLLFTSLFLLLSAMPYVYMYVCTLLIAPRITIYLLKLSQSAFN